MLSPDDITIRPPEPYVPLPTETLTLPLVPEVAEPVLKTIEPVLPSVDVPDFIEMLPLTPDAPASALNTLNAPLLVADPKPDIIETDPPDMLVLSPACKSLAVLQQRTHQMNKV